MGDRIRKLSDKQHIMLFFIFTILLFYVIAFVSTPFDQLWSGIQNIVISRDVLLTDYFVVGGIGASFLNSAIVMTISLAIIQLLKLNFSGLTIAAVMIMGGFSLFGKHPLNTIPIILGSMLYAKMQGVNIGRYIYVGFMATAISPLLTELVHILPFSLAINLCISFAVGLFIGYITPSLSAHTVGMHMGYNLFNVGFAIGIIALCVTSMLSAFGFQMETTLIWQSGRPLWLIVLFYSYFILIGIYGLLVCKFNFKGYLQLMKHPGRTVADFLLMDGAGLTLVNIAAVGVLSLSYVLLIGGDLSGPVIGAILTVAGFAAFGIHPKNFSPVLLGVFIAGTLHIYTPTTPALQIAAIFSGALSPIAGQFGIIPGIIAGFIHSAVVCNTVSVYSGMNLYNNGFSAGIVAILLLPIIESFMKRYSKN